MLPPKLSSEIALFLDFDGTLVPIAPTPDGIIVPQGTPAVLKDVLEYLSGALAIVSGRGLEEVFNYLKPYNGPGAGSHGLEIRLADSQMVEPDAGVSAVAADIRQSLRGLVAAHPGLIAEEKPWSAALHFRNNPELEALCVATMEQAVAQHPGWELTRGKMVLEARPEGISKASAVTAMMQQRPFAGRVPVFIGDDVTDEDGMRAATELGGYGIKVGPGESVARYRLESPEAVFKYLESR